MSTQCTKRTADEIRREYQRNWRAKNKDKVKKYNHDYWQRKAKNEQKDA